MGKEGSRSISISADRDYVDAVHMLARNKGTNSAKLVRDALDTLFGDDLKEYLAFLAAKRDTIKLQSSQKSEVPHVS